MQIKYWIRAFRLRTLPLALCSVGMGAILAYQYGSFQAKIFGLTVATTIFLQILSNLANDYGDARSGIDQARKGEQRMVQSGLISHKAMLKAIFVFVLFSLFSGIWLLYEAFFRSTTQIYHFLSFLVLGLLAIVAAITYTMGKKPYGYVGLGDLAVLIFFGWVGVIGAFYLHTQEWNKLIVLPATSCGLFSVAVLNINNIRDIESDSQAGKNSIPVRLGKAKAVWYHYFLLISATLLAVWYNLLISAQWQAYLFLLILPLLWKNAWAVRNLQGLELDSYLKQMALTTLLFVVLFGIGVYWK
ncbi:MAG: 1,4-dihydroxy-2-naphthoate octaprenyltransferase [Bacteroidia bacterium]|jgi:1,4-dihydroxy-2-naphthoate octaprenyltransferase|nr:MAG: 1,4-dihydroxy-2-naphthoate octaprenyltransferase [Bacteroidia bacterium]